MSDVAFIANARTKVEVNRSIDQIRRLVERFRAREFRTIYNEHGEPSAVRFTITDPHLSKVEGETGLFTVELAAPSVYIAKLLFQNSTRSAVNCHRQAQRISWRQLHDIIRATLIGVEAGLFTIGEAFLANLIVETETGEQRFGQMLMERRMLTPSNGRLLLGKGA